MATSGSEAFPSSTLCRLTTECRPIHTTQAKSGWRPLRTPPFPNYAVERHDRIGHPWPPHQFPVFSKSFLFSTWWFVLLVLRAMVAFPDGLDGMKGEIGRQLVSEEEGQPGRQKCILRSSSHVPAAAGDSGRLPRWHWGEGAAARPEHGLAPPSPPASRRKAWALVQSVRHATEHGRSAHRVRTQTLGEK